MTDQNASGAQAASAAPPSPVNTAPAAPPQAPPAAPSSVSIPTETFNERIAQAKRSAEVDLAKSLGFASVDEMRAAADAGKKAAEANKTAEQRVTELQAQLAAEKERGDVYEETLKARAASELASLPETQRAAVLALAGDDAGAQILAIDTLKPTWSASAPAANPPAPQAAPASPSNTAPPREAPAPNPAGQPDPYQTYLAIKAKNPFAAANYRMQHAAAIADGELKKT